MDSPLWILFGILVLSAVFLIPLALLMTIVNVTMTFVALFQLFAERLGVGNPLALIIVTAFGQIFDTQVKFSTHRLRPMSQIRRWPLRQVATTRNFPGPEHLFDWHLYHLRRRVELDGCKFRQWHLVYVEQCTALCVQPGCEDVCVCDRARCQKYVYSVPHHALVFPAWCRYWCCIGRGAEIWLEILTCCASNVV